MAEIRFPRYRMYVENRVEVNDAMTALLVGSRLAAHTLTLTTGSRATLSELFPAVEHVSRFNMRSDVAQNFLNNADHHIASVAVPYALAAHEEFIMDILEFIQNQGIAVPSPPGGIKAWNMHETLYGACNENPPTASLESFHVLRETRNCVIHAGGQAGSRLTNTIQAMGSQARAEWASINLGAAPEALKGADGKIVLTPEHIFTAFALTKKLGREVNDLLGRAIPMQVWAGIAVKDFVENTSRYRNSSAWKRSLVGYCRNNYSSLALTDSALEAAARQLGEWTVTQWG